MSGSAAVPPWVPYGARAMQEVAGLTNEVAMRILCDKRMEQAWKDLRRLPESSDLHERVALIPACFSPDGYGVQVENLTTFDRLAAALFYQVMIEVYQPQRTYWTRGEAEKMARPFFDAAKLCQEAPITDPTLQARVDLLAALELVEGYFRSQGEMRTMQYNPRVLGRRLPTVSDEKRGHARMIATMIRDLFSPPADHFPHSAVTRFLVVSLGRDDDVDELKESVRDWCKDLPPERSNAS